MTKGRNPCNDLTRCNDLPRRNDLTATARTRHLQHAESTEGPHVSVDCLTCNHARNPLGVDDPRPKLSWKLHSGVKGQHQTAYRVVAASSCAHIDHGSYDLWDTGKVESSDSVFVKYAGRPLRSRQRCFWRVMVWDKDDRPSCWSGTARFEMGLLNRSDWKARWIAADAGYVIDLEVQPAPFLRRQITLDRDVVSATAYVCGLGYYELRINGQKAGDSVLTPAFTKYDRTVLYDTIDVTGLLGRGENAIGVILGNGWYNCFTEEVWMFAEAPWRHRPKLLFQLHIELADGTSLVVGSDTGWRVTTGPIIFDGLRNGEHYDARKELSGWDMPGYDDSSWKHASVIAPPGGDLRSSQMPPIRVTGTIRPVEVREVSPGTFVYDLGQNISGWARIRAEGPAGTEIVLRYGERLAEDGSLDQAPIARFVRTGEFQTDRYTMKGEGIETWEPRFTYHGFRYVEITGFPGTPTLDNLVGRVVHTDFDQRGVFECSNETLSSIQRCVRWSTLTNYHGIPTDCPHREKNGWTGDAQFSAEQTLLNFNPATAYAKWMRDFRDVQRPSGQLPGIVPTGGWGYNWGSGPAWDSAIVLIPWYVYLYTGDRTVIEEMYDSIRLYVDYMTQMAVGQIVEFGLGDWCPPYEGDPDHPRCPTAVTDTAYYYTNALLLSKMARLTGRYDDELKYAKLAEDVKKAFRDRFVNSSTGVVEGNCQTSMACALYQGLASDDDRELVFKRLVEQVELRKRHMDCGTLGAKYIMHVLTDNGRADLAYDIATQRSYPGWGYWIEQGATTLWESWSGDSSLNHHMFSDVSAWFYKGLAGINPVEEAPGFKHVVIRPNPVSGLGWVRAAHESMYGTVSSEWRIEGDRFELRVRIPVNCTATVMMPAEYCVSVTESGRPIDGSAGGSGNAEGGARSAGGGASYVEDGVLGICRRAGRISIEVGSGDYVFMARNVQRG